MNDVASAEPQPQQAQAAVAKPGTACLGCRRRKLKCSREQEGCAHCTKSALPCVYPQPEAGVKRKRGPYKKDKPARERHLEDLVRYLEPRASASNAKSGAKCDGESGESLSGLPANLQGNEVTQRQNSQTRDLVKDALIALTGSSASERENGNDFGGVVRRAPQVQARPFTSSHPPARQVFEYWRLFVTRVEPLTKILHCSTFADRLFTAIDEPAKLGCSTHTLLFSIYYSAVSTCTAGEAQSRFDVDKDALLHQYSRVLEGALADNYGMPTLESVQALILYIICLRRQDDTTNLKALFSLAVRLAQMICLHQDPAEMGLNPLECELRRRLWFHICQLESRGAEEGEARSNTVLEGSDVRFPANLNDCDLHTRATEVPISRSGITEMTFARVRWESQRMVYGLWIMKKQAKASGKTSDLKVRQDAFFAEACVRLQKEYLDHMDSSRPYDRMCRLFLEGMINKVRMMIEHPFSQIPHKDMAPHERFKLLQSSVYVISFTHSLATDQRIEQWQWFFRSYVQWHSLAIVVAELPRIKDRRFTLSAWAVLDPILTNWDRTYALRKGESAWDHVNALIQRAREMRVMGAVEKDSAQPAPRSVQQKQRGPVSVARMASDDHTATSAKCWSNTSAGDAIGTDITVAHAMPTDAPLQHRTPIIMRPFVATADVSQPKPFLGCRPTSFDLDVDFSNLYDHNEWDGLGEVDFGAFDQVFGDWAFLSPETVESNVMIMGPGMNGA